MKTKPFIISLVILSLSIAAIAAVSSRGTPAVTKTNLENLPMEIAGYSAVEDSFSQGIYDELNADKHVYRHYRNDTGDQVDLYIGYYGTAKGGRTGHNPYACLPGAGWGILDAQKIKLMPSNYPNGVKVRYILSRKGQNYEVVVHWYQSAGTKVLSSGIAQNIQRFIGKTFYNRNDGAFIRISSLTDEGHIEKTKEKVESFAQKILDIIPHYWPVEK